MRLNNPIDVQNEILRKLNDLDNSSSTSSNVVVTNTPLPVSLTSGTVTITGPVTVSNEVEIKNDIGNPIPVNGIVNVGNFPTSQNVVVTSSVLPTGAAQEHITANSYHSTRLTDGTNFYDARIIRPLTAADVVSIAGTINTTNTDRRYEHYLALTKEDSEECIIRYTYDLNGNVITTDLLDTDYNVSGLPISLASNYENKSRVVSLNFSNSSNSGSLINQYDFIEYENVDVNLNTGYLTCYVDGNFTESPLISIFGDTLTLSQKQALKYEVVSFYNSVLNRRYYTFMFQLIKSNKIRIELKDDSLFGGYLDCRLAVSSRMVNIDNNVISRETREILGSDVSDTYNGHTFFDKDYTKETYLKSIAASLLPYDNETIPKKLEDINTSILTTDYNQTTNSFHPNPINYVVENVSSDISIDSSGNLQTRSAVFTDEGSFRYDFEGTSLYNNITGTLTFNNTEVIGVGTSFLTELTTGQYIKLVADGDVNLRRIVKIINNNQLILDSNYPTGSGSAHYSYVRYNAFNGSTITYNNSFITLSSDTVIGAACEINRFIDYSPLSLNVKLNQSQRLNTQTTYIGLQEPGTNNPKWFARFRLTGTTNTVLVCETAGIKSGIVSAADIETTNVIVPSGLTTVNDLIYRIEVKTRGILFYINDILVATHTIHIPSQYDLLEFKVIIANTGLSTNTNVNIDYVNFNNINEVSIYNPSNNEGFVANNAPVLTYTGLASANNTNLVLIECNQIRSLFIKFSGTFNATVSFQGDNDANFTNPVAVQAIPAAGGTIATTANTTGSMYNIPVTTRYIRFRTTSYTSGTPTITVQALQQESAQAIVSVGNTVAVAQSGSWNTTPTPSTTQGFNLARSFTSDATNNATLVKNSAAVISNITLVNLSTATAYLKLYSKATAPIPGTDVPFITYPIPGTFMGMTPNTITLSFSMGLRLSSGLGYAITRNFSPLDNTAIGANEIQGNILYI